MFHRLHGLSLLMSICLLGQTMWPSSVSAQPKPPIPLPGNLFPGKLPTDRAPDPAVFLKQLSEKLNSTNPSERLSAAEQLPEVARFGTKLATDALIKGLDDGNAHVRYAALYALAGMGPDAAAALPRIHQIVSKTQAEYERVLAAWAVTRIAVDAKELQSILPLLVSSLDSESEAVANQAAEVLTLCGAEAETPLLTHLKQAPTRGRVLALDVLGRIQARDAVVEIAEQLRSPSTAVRAAAAKALGEIGPAAKESLPSLQKVFTTDPSAAVKARAAAALGSLGVPSPELLQALAQAASGADEVVARTAVRSLMQLNPDAELMNRLLPRLLSDQRASVITEAMVALAEQGEAGLPALRTALANKESRYWALLVISDLGPTAKAMTPQLAELLSGADPLTKRETLMALAKIGPAAGVAAPQVVRELSHREKSVRYAATLAIGSLAIRSDAALAALAANMKEDDTFLQMTSAWALAKLSPSDPLAGLRAIQKLASGLTSNNPTIQQAAAQCLIDLKPGPAQAPALIPRIVQSFSSDNPQVKASALDAITAVLRQGEPGPILTGALNNAAVRPLAALTTQRLGPTAKSAVPALAAALSDPRSDVRREVALALAAIGPEAAAAVPDLVVAVRDSHAVVRQAAATALGEIGPQAAAGAPPLRQILASADNSVKPTAAWALCKIAPNDPENIQAALPELIANLRSADPTDRRLAALALAMIGPAAASAKAELVYASEDSDASVRAAANAALMAIE